MKSIIMKSLQGLLLVPALVLGVSAVAPVMQPASVYAACGDPATSGVEGGINCAQENAGPKSLFGASGFFTTIINILLFVIGAVAVIMLIYGGFRYVTSGGDASAVTSAKNTILYAIVGIIIALLAYAIVNFVLTSLTGSGSTA